MNSDEDIVDENPNQQTLSADNSENDDSVLSLEVETNVHDESPIPVASKYDNTGYDLSPAPTLTECIDWNAPNLRLPTPPTVHDEIIKVDRPKGEMAEKLAKSAPYNFFLTTVTDSEPTHNEPLSVTFQELLDPSLGEIETSVQINFVVDGDWLLKNYRLAGVAHKPLLILYGQESYELEKLARKHKNITLVQVPMARDYGCHHTKVMMFAYKDNSMRIVVSTANLYPEDWNNRTQGLWISPKCEPLPPKTDRMVGESPTEFRKSLNLLLNWYKDSHLQSWIKRINRTNFADINVFLVTSVPGSHRVKSSTGTGYRFGHPRIGELLAEHCAPINSKIPLVTQSSSIGKLVSTGIEKSWLTTNILPNFCKHAETIDKENNQELFELKIIYPSLANVENSHDKLSGGGCLLYNKNLHKKQKWIKKHMHQWKFDERHRSMAMPHTKCYCRWSEDDGLYWFLLTSANLSGSALGGYKRPSKYGVPLFINNYEAGVLFLPKFVLKSNAKTFPLNESLDGIPPFPLPFDFPLTPYEEDDKPFLIDYLVEEQKARVTNDS